MKKRENGVNSARTGTPRARPKRALTLKCGRCTDLARRAAGLVCHVCITRHWFFCRGLALQPFILCFAVGPNGFEKFCYSPVTPEANVRIDFTCTGLHHLSRAGAVRAKAKWKVSILNYSDSPCSLPGRRPRLQAAARAPATHPAAQGGQENSPGVPSRE